jgi:predicted RND superfamily exporter protein
LFNYRLLTAIFILIFAAVLTAFLRLDIDTDIVRSLPSDQSVVSDAIDIFTKHPIHDQIAITISLNIDDQNILADCGEYVEERLKSSNLFEEVGTDEIANLIPDLALHITKNLPILFSQQELEQNIAPRIENDFIDTRFKEILQKLNSLEGIGQSTLITSDPLGFMEPVMAKMAMLTPLPDTTIYRGFVFSPDKRHLLVTARPNSAGTNTASAGQIADLLDDIAIKLQDKYSLNGIKTEITPVGAYRAALDNERIIRHDVNLALLLSTAGIGILLFIAFPRPMLGLLALLPALAGTATSLFFFSLLHSSISIMVLGFGGAIISITVDHGIAYLLFMDRSKTTKGKEASGEVRAIGILAVLTTSGAFLTLSFSGFPVFVQLGQFTAMGILFSFLFVHCIFPLITPSMVPSAKKRKPPLQGAVDKLYGTGRFGALAAAFLACFLFFFARPEFNVSLESMNTVSSETLAAEELFTNVWGNMSNKIVLMITKNSVVHIQQKNDSILQFMVEDKAAKIVESAFIPSMIFPGRELAKKNLVAWKEFWNTERIEKLEDQIQKNSTQLGFATDGFDRFLKLLSPSHTTHDTVIPARFYKLMGISEQDGQLIQFINVSPGEKYNSKHFYDRYGVNGKIFDSPYFAEQLGDILFNSFVTMLGIIAFSIVLLLVIFFASWQLTLITLLPPLFAYVCTLGTMKLIGHPLDIPGLMLSIVILGMGIDYSIFFVRAHQRYRDPTHPSFTLVRMAVFMAGTSTIIGFGVLCFAEHSLLRSIGVTSLLGVGYSLLGAFLLLPPLLQSYFTKKVTSNKHHVSITKCVRNRYRLMEAYPRMFARFKLQCDPMFSDLPKLLITDRARIQTILDIGCGYGVPGCWCLEYCPNAKVFGLDPDSERVRVAGLAMANRGEMLEAMAPDLPVLPNSPDLVLLLDMLHYLDDDSIAVLFANCYKAIADKGLLLTRFVIRPTATPSWAWKLEEYRIRISGGKTYYRSADKMAELMGNAGFHIETNMTTESNTEMIWLMGRAGKE